MNAPARFCLRLGTTLVLSLMVTWLWVGPREEPVAIRRTTIDASDPAVHLALGVLQAAPEVVESSRRVAPAVPHVAPVFAPALDVACSPAISDLMLPDEIVPVVAPAQAIHAASPSSEDV